MWFVGQARENEREMVVCKGCGWVDAQACLFSSSAPPRSSGTPTGKPLQLCTSERPEGDKLG